MGSEQIEEQPAGQLPHENMGELIPGTEFMRNVGNSDAIESTDEHFILLPKPSLDPADPLNWSNLRKALVGLTLALYTFVTSNSVSAMAPMYPLFAETFSLSETQLPLITGVTVIVLGFSNFIAVPCSKILGRRAVALSFGVLFLVTCIWQAVATSYGSFMASRVVNGIAAAPSETLMVQVIADIFFLHERGFWMGMYFASASLGAFIGPVISGNIAQRHGWRSFFWLSTGLIGFTLVLLFFLFPETNYEDREQSDLPSESVAVTSTLKHEEVESGHTQHVEILGHKGVAGKGHPSSKQYWLSQKPHPLYKKFLVRDFIGPFRAAFLPIVLFAALNVMGSVNLVLYWNITESSVLGAPPYNFSASQVGFANFGLAGGAIVGMATAGPFSDWVVKKATERNNGVREAEMRLTALIPFTIITVVGTVIGGIAVRDGWSWPVLIVIGFGSAGITIASIPAIAVAYTLDVYRPISGEIMVVATIYKNTTGFAMTYWVAPMVVKHGYLLPLMVWFVFTVGPILLAVPLYIWGKKLRSSPFFRGHPVNWKV